jgi:hypothetical protein
MPEQTGFAHQEFDVELPQEGHDGFVNHGYLPFVHRDVVGSAELSPHK